MFRYQALTEANARSFAVAFSICLLFGQQILPRNASAAPPSVDVCFVPAESCASRIVAAIDGARREIRVQAYGITAAPILAAITRARARGVDVAALLDRSNEQGLRTGLAALQRGGVPVWIDAVPGIAHIKAIVIDRHLVIGGSYNYTAAAERRNVEDVTFTDSPALAARFLEDWRQRRSLARPPR